MRIDVDLSADALYVWVCGGSAARTARLDDRVLVDVAADGSVAGFEVLGVGSLPVDGLLAAYTLPDRYVAQLRALAAAWVSPRLQVA